MSYPIDAEISATLRATDAVEAVSIRASRSTVA